MSFRELRNFAEMMRALGYPRPISVENFRQPNFELVADTLHWMVHKYDPSLVIPEEIDTEEDRIEFLSVIGSVMLSKARIRLNTCKLYAADGFAVKELLKICKILYDASKIDPSMIDDEEDLSIKSLLSSKLKDTKTTRLLSGELIDSGSKIYGLLEKEMEIKDSRYNALRFLDAISSNLESTVEHQYLEKNLVQIVNNMKENIENIEKQCVELENDEKKLTNNIKKKQSEIERDEKRLKNLQTVRPAFMDEYEKLEKELEFHYDIYCKRYRNLDYLQYELELYNDKERQKLKENDRSLKKMQKKLRDEELRILRGEQEDTPLDVSMENNNASPIKINKKKINKKDTKNKNNNKIIQSKDMEVHSSSDEEKDKEDLKRESESTSSSERDNENNESDDENDNDNESNDDDKDSDNEIKNNEKNNNNNSDDEEISIAGSELEDNDEDSSISQDDEEEEEIKNNTKKKNSSNNRNKKNKKNIKANESDVSESGSDQEF